MHKRSTIGVAIGVALCVVVAAPAAAAKPTTSDGKYCYDVSFSSDIAVPPVGQVAMQQLALGEDCRLRAEATVVLPASAMAEGVTGVVEFE